MSNPDHVDLPELDAVDPTLNVQLAITPAEAQLQLKKVMLSALASDPEKLKEVLDAIEAAIQAKMSAQEILGIIKTVLTGGLSFIL